MTLRVTQLVAEAVTAGAGTPTGRVTQLAVPVLTAGNPQGRVTGFAVMVLTSRNNITPIVGAPQANVSISC